MFLWRSSALFEPLIRRAESYCVLDRVSLTRTRIAKFWAMSSTQLLSRIAFSPSAIAS